MNTLNKDHQQSIAVIGAGIIGINCAIALQQSGFQVSVFDRNPPGEGCSKGNAGHFATEQVFPLADFGVLKQLPKMLLDPLGPVAIAPSFFPKVLPWFIQFIANMFKGKRNKNIDALRALNEAALASYQPVIKQAKAEHLFKQQGSLLVFEQTPLNAIKALQEDFQAQGVAVELLDKQALKAIEPNLHQAINYGLFFTGVAHTVEPLHFSQCLANYASSIGVNFIQQEVEWVSVNNDKAELSYDWQHQSFDQIVIACGAYSTKFAQQLGYKLPLVGERGYSLDMPASSINTLNRPVASAERKFIITPMAHGLRLAGTVEFDQLGAKANYKRAQMLFENAQFIVNKLPTKQEIEHQGWLGSRPSLPDSLPVIGRAPKHQSVIFATGHQHLGLTLGAITGKLVEQIATAQTPDIDLSPFCLSRFQ